MEPLERQGFNKALDDLRHHAWDYFELHAEQRLKTFHFYIVLETGLVAALLFAARTGSPDMRAIVMVGTMMVFFSFVFWKLDQRVKGMIKVSERALKVYEQHICASHEELRQSAPFINDPQAKGQVGISPFGVISYSKCFGAVFLAFGFVGAVVALLPILL